MDAALLPPAAEALLPAEARADSGVSRKQRRWRDGSESAEAARPPAYTPYPADRHLLGGAGDAGHTASVCPWLSLCI